MDTSVNIPLLKETEELIIQAAEKIKCEPEKLLQISIILGSNRRLREICLEILKNRGEHDERGDN